MSEPNHSTTGDHFIIVFRSHAVALIFLYRLQFKDEESISFDVEVHFPILYYAEKTISKPFIG